MGFIASSTQAIEFFHWRHRAGIAGFPGRNLHMSNPTDFVLSGSFAAAIGLFLISALLRWVLAPRRWAVAAPPPVTDDVSWQGDESPMLGPVLPDTQHGKVPVWFYRPLDLLGIGIMFFVFGGLALSAGQKPLDPSTSLSPMVLVVNIVFQFILAGVVILIVNWRVTPVLWLGLRWPSWPWVFLIAPCSVFFMWVSALGLEFSGYMKWMKSFDVETVQDTVKVLQTSENPLVLGLMAFAAIITAPICEEIVFRGYFYPAMKKFAGVWPAAVASSLIFGLAHGNLTALFPLFVFGLLLVFVYEKTGSLWAPVAVHFCFNGSTVIIQLLARYFHLPVDASP